MKKYCLLENGTIEPCYYGTGEPRNIYQSDNKKWYIDHDVFTGCCIMYRHDEIIKFADTIEELEAVKNETN